MLRLCSGSVCCSFIPWRCGRFRCDEHCVRSSKVFVDALGSIVRMQPCQVAFNVFYVAGFDMFKNRSRPWQLVRIRIGDAGVSYNQCSDPMAPAYVGSCKLCTCFGALFPVRLLFLGFASKNMFIHPFPFLSVCIHARSV